MSSKFELDEIGARRIMAAIVEQAYVDCGSSDPKEREEALQFFYSAAFESAALALKLNARRVRTLAGKEFYKAKIKTDEKNTRTRPHKKRKRQPAAQKYQLGEISGELRRDLSEPPTHLL